MKDHYTHLIHIIIHMLKQGIRLRHVPEILEKRVSGEEYEYFIKNKDKVMREIFHRVSENQNINIDMKDELYEMNSIFESYSKYEIKDIAKAAFNNLEVWINTREFSQVVNELKLKGDSEEGLDFEEQADILHDFFDANIDKFFTALRKYHGIEKEYLEENRDNIIYAIIELTIPEVEDRNAVSDQKLGGEQEMEEDPKLAAAMRQSRELQKVPKPKNYAEMGKNQLRDEVDKAIEAGDFETLKKIQPYIKENTFLAYHIEDALNEEYLIKPLLNEGCNCGGKKKFTLTRRPTPVRKPTIRPSSRPRPGASKT